MSKKQKTAERAAPAETGNEMPNTSGRTGSESTSIEVISKRKKTVVSKAAHGQAKPAKTALVNAPTVNAATENEAEPATPKSTKQEQVLTMLSQVGGSTIDEIMKATGWQQHSVRGFFAGTVRKKLGFELTSEKEEGEERRYAINVAA
jgi:hypothetical protein